MNNILNEVNVKIIKPFLGLLCFTVLYAGEVDHYLSWSHLPSGSSAQLNNIYNREIQDALDAINLQTPDCSCEDAAGRILQHFGVVLNSPIEQHIKQSFEIDHTPSVNTNLPEYFRNSVFWKETNSTSQNRLQEIILDTQIDEIINVDGIYIGLDKLTHFMGSGYLYYQVYRIALKNGSSEDDAIKKAIQMGIFSEKKVLGKIPSGVFSYADLESNFQGFLFAKNLCSKKEPHLEKTTAGWTLMGEFNLNDYVNPYWDESYNPSYYYKGFNLTLMPKSKTVLMNLPKYCAVYQTDEIQAMFTYYDSIAKPSFSVNYLKTLVDKNEIPNPNMFDIRALCKKVK